MAQADLGGGNVLRASEVLAYAQRVSRMRTDVGVNLCQRFVRMAFGSDGGAPTALAAWGAASSKHRNGTPPAGAAVFWGGGTAGHVAISAGNGWVYSTDVKEPGKVDLVPMSFITQRWGKPLLGWTEENNGIKIAKWDAKPVKGEGAGSLEYAPVYSGNSTTQGGGAATGYSQKELRERYGYVAALYEDVPEIQRLVKMAIRGGWTEEEFDRRLQASKWYRNHTEEERQWVVLENSQPGEAKQRVEQQRQEIIRQYRQMGVPVSGKRVEKLARMSVIHGWTPQQLTNAIAAEFDYKPKEGPMGGLAGETIDELKAMAAAYVVPISNKTMERWTQHVLRGEADVASFESYLKDQAKSMWDDPQMQAAIDRGITTEDYLSPYREMAASELEMNPDDINWLGNPKWSQAIYDVNAKGERRFKSLADWQRELRTNSAYGFDKTSGARDASAQLTTELAQTFGVRG